MLDFSQVLSLACNVLWKLPVCIESLHRFCRALYFQSKMFDKLVPVRVLLRATDFERVLYGKIHARFLCEHCSFKVWVHWCCGLWKYIVGHTKIRVFTCICLHLQICKNAIISKSAACQTQYFGEILHFQMQMCGKRWELCIQFMDWPFKKI